LAVKRQGFPLGVMGLMVVVMADGLAAQRRKVSC